MSSNSLLTESGRNKPMKENTVSKISEKQSSTISSILFLALAGGAIGLSLGLAVGQKKKRWSNFSGLWAPTFLLLGMYNKMKLPHDSGNSGRQTLLH